MSVLEVKRMLKNILELIISGCSLGRETATPVGAEWESEEANPHFPRKGSFGEPSQVPGGSHTGESACRCSPYKGHLWSKAVNVKRGFKRI